MSLVFANQTDFDALQFDQIDPLGEPYHVFVVRIAYDIVSDAKGQAALQQSEEAATLVEEDEYFGGLNQSSVRCESDLAPYKPCCDVILNASAHAPRHQSTRRFEVGLRVSRPDRPAPLPAPPQALNPFMPLTLAQQAAWQAEVAALKQVTLPSRVLIDKRLMVTGARQFKKKALLTRCLQGVLRWASLGLIRPSPWKLSRPAKLVELPLRHEFAWGGQARINQRDNSHWATDTKSAQVWQDNPKPARRLPKALRLTPEQLARHPENQASPALQPVAHQICETNPLGRGYAPAWYLRASQLKSLPAPQIEYPQAPITAAGFWRSVQGKTELTPAGFGCVGRAWQPRRRLIGVIEEKAIWEDDEYPQLPPDFDHGYWNAAPHDQQCPHLIGDEVFELLNLCPDRAPGRIDDGGHHRLRFQLPGIRPYLMFADAQGNRGAKLMDLDTVIIDPETGRVELVWRCIVTARADLVEAQLHVAETAAKRLALKEWLPPQQRAELDGEVTHGA
ncbi:MAG: DUF2169 domain-containing protein [Rhodocyclales bacterium GT-UBC]|nr:MAG: DUF2169 domain-containing protein [Rhodocyclales bacterium GT-UBC]